MKKWYHSIEVVVDRLVPPAVILLLIVIIIEFFFHNIAETYHTYVLIADYAIIVIFIIDLLFKYLRIRNFPKFLRTSWLDIIAVFPFFLIFRAFETIIILAEIQREVKNVQMVLHESVEISKGASKIIKEAEAAGKISRVKTILRMFKGLQRSPRLLKALAFYEQPVGKHHLHKVEGKRTYKKVKKELEEIEDDITFSKKKKRKKRKK